MKTSKKLLSIGLAACVAMPVINSAQAQTSTGTITIQASLPQICDLNVLSQPTLGSPTTLSTSAPVNNVTVGIFTIQSNSPYRVAAYSSNVHDATGANAASTASIFPQLRLVSGSSQSYSFADGDTWLQVSGLTYNGGGAQDGVLQEPSGTFFGADCDNFSAPGGAISGCGVEISTSSTYLEVPATGLAPRNISVNYAQQPATRYAGTYEDTLFLGLECN